MLTAGASVLVPGFHVAPTKLSINASCPGRALITTDSFLKVPPCPSHQLETLSASCQLWGCLSQRDLGHPVPLSFHYSPCMLTPWVTVKFSIPVFELCDLHRATTLARDTDILYPAPDPGEISPASSSTSLMLPSQHALQRRSLGMVQLHPSRQGDIPS